MSDSKYNTDPEPLDGPLRRCPSCNRIITCRHCGLQRGDHEKWWSKDHAYIEQGESLVD